MRDLNKGFLPFMQSQYISHSKNKKRFIAHQRHYLEQVKINTYQSNYNHEAQIETITPSADSLKYDFFRLQMKKEKNPFKMRRVEAKEPPLRFYKCLPLLQQYLLMSLTYSYIGLEILRIQKRIPSWILWKKSVLPVNKTCVNSQHSLQNTIQVKTSQ